MDSHVVYCLHVMDENEQLQSSNFTALAYARGYPHRMTTLPLSTYTPRPHKKLTYVYSLHDIVIISREFLR